MNITYVMFQFFQKTSGFGNENYVERRNNEEAKNKKNC